LLRVDVAVFMQHGPQQLLRLRRNMTAYAAANAAVKPQQSAEFVCGLIYLARSM